MWIFCKEGFFSAVEHNSKPDTILLRARFKGDLEKLRERFPAIIGAETRIKHTPNADYAYRLEVSKTGWAAIVAIIAMEIDYGNFKNSVHDGTIRDSAYMDCWFALRQAQEEQE